MPSRLGGEGERQGAPTQITRAPPPDARVHFAPEFGQRFVVTVDTEEEFDWAKPFERTGHGLSHVPRLAKFQQFCEGFGVAPIYLIDYPIASDPAVGMALGDAVRHGRAEIGVQLHPWVNPPHQEQLNVFNSFAGNLPPALERAKLVKLRDTMDLTVYMVTHDLDSLFTTCDRVAVLYAGRIAEERAVDPLFATPAHPYTTALIDCIPRDGMTPGSLHGIPGAVPTSGRYPPGCRFNPRCTSAADLCRQERPLLRPLHHGGAVACHFANAEAP